MKKPLSQVVSTIVSNNQREKVSNELLGLGLLAAAGGATLATAVGYGIKAIRAAKQVKEIKDSLKEHSLSEFAQASTLTPLVLIEQSLADFPPIKDILGTLTNVFAAYYLQSIALSTVVGKVTIASKLDQFSTNRKGDLINQVADRFGVEAYYEHTTLLPDFSRREEIANIINNKLIQQSLESNNQDKQEGDDKKKNEVYTGKMDLSKIAEVPNLVLGKVLNVPITEGGVTHDIPVTIRLLPNRIPEPIMLRLLLLGDIKESWTERWHRYRSGEISFADWMFQSDVIRDRKRLLAMDKTGVYKEMLSRRKNNKVAAAISGKASLGSASAMVIITEDTAKEYQMRTGETLYNDKAVDRFFKENSAMLLAIVSPEWERVTLYTRGIAGKAEYTLSDFKQLSKGNGPDVSDLLKAYMAGSQPRF